MKKRGIVDCIAESIEDKRADNTTIPFELVLALSIGAKMKSKTSLSDIPYAITDHRVIAELGYNVIDTDINLENGLMRESSLRFLVGKYSYDELFSSYNKAIQEYIMPKEEIKPDIHILDCTKLCVNYKNMNYEMAGIGRDNDGNVAKGYKLATIRGIVEDSGIIEEICFGAMNIHDLELSKDMLKNTKVFKRGDILINDRGFLDRELTNYLKTERGVDTYIPLKNNMQAYNMAVSAAKLDNKWEQHPTREKQKIAFVTDLAPFWESDTPKNDVSINGVVVWDTETDSYFVFVTTDTTVSAKQIIKTYELRPEIEEDYRQLKDFWKLEDFKSTKLNMIAFHIISTLFGYLFFQLYVIKDDGKKYSHKSFPIILKNYNSQIMPYLIFYAKDEFGILTIIEFAQIYSSCCKERRKELDEIFNLLGIPFS